MTTGDLLAEGWYLMNLDELEQELRRAREPGTVPPTRVPALPISEALARRNAGNVPDDHGRTLRLVLHVDQPPRPGEIERKRLAFEPDYHEAPRWRRPGSAPVNVVPLRVAGGRRGAQSRAWIDDSRIASLEAEWRTAGTIAGLRVPGELRGFVFKTVVALQDAGKDVTAESVSASIARWVRPDDAASIRAALVAANEPD
jgi:hypothetical protein